jgi:hypothetical protein
MAVRESIESLEEHQCSPRILQSAGVPPEDHRANMHRFCCSSVNIRLKSVQTVMRQSRLAMIHG